MNFLKLNTDTVRIQVILSQDLLIYLKFCYTKDYLKLALMKLRLDKKVT